MWPDGDLRYVRCSECGAVFSDIDAAHYGSEQHNVWNEDDLSDDTVAYFVTARERAYTSFLSRVPPSGAQRLLDVGCGLGYFVERAMAAGWDAFGCDVAAPWVEQARRRVGAERIALSPPSARVFGETRFDLVTAWDVLEHVHDPLPFVVALAQLLAPGGRLFIRTPNIAWVYPTYWIRRNVLAEEIELGPLNHVVYYSSTTLTRALKAADLEPLEWPVMAPQQVSFANRNPSQAGQRSAVTTARNTYAALANRVSRVTRGRIVVGGDLDVLAARRDDQPAANA